MATKRGASTGQVTAERKRVFVKVKDLKPGTSEHTLIVKVVDTTTVKTSSARLAECLVGDETGSIIFTARNEQVDLLKQGATVILLNAKFMFEGTTVKLAVDKGELIEGTEPAKFAVNKDKNFSITDYACTCFICNCKCKCKCISFG